jgi:hypothetical protein
MTKQKATKSVSALGKRKEKQTSQFEEFRKKARELGCDDTTGEDEVMRRLAGQKRHEDAG